MARALVLYALAGGVSGLLALAVAGGLRLLTDLWMGRLLGYLPPAPSGEGGLGQVFAQPHPWLGVVLFPPLYAAASLLGSNRGLSRLILAFRLNERVRLLPQLRYVLGSLVELPAASPLGREGPMAVLGDWAGRRLGASLAPEEARAMGHAGLAAGFAAAFHAPLAGALLATEIFYRSLRLEAAHLTPALVGSFAGFTLYGAVFGYGPWLELRPGTLGAAELWAALGLALAVAILANLWALLIRGAFRLGQRVPYWQRHLLLGLVLGLLVLAVPEVAGDGSGWLELAGFPLLGTRFLAVFFVLRYLLAGLFVGLGGYGAPLTPALVLGGSLGLLLARVLPWPVDPGTLALAGMAAWLAGAARTPLAAVALAGELAGYRVLPVVVLAAGVGYALVRWSLFSEQAEG